MSPYDPDIHHRRSIRLKGYDYASEGLYFVTMCVQNRECLFGEIINNEMVLNDAGRMVEKWYNKTQDKFPDIVCHEMIIMPNHFHCIWENVGLHGASAVGADPCVRPVTNDVRPLSNNVRRVTNDVNHDPYDCLIEKNVRPIEPNNKHIVDNDNHIVDEGAHADAPIQMNDTYLDIPNNIIDKYGGDEGGHANDDERNIMEGGHMGPPLRDTDLGMHTGSPLSSVVQWFKTMSTNEYIRGVNELGWPPFDRKLWQRNYYEHIIRDDTSLQTIAYYIINNPSLWQNDKFYQPSKSI